MTIYDLKPAFQNLLRPGCRALANAGVTANQVTVVALLISIVVGVLLEARMSFGSCAAAAAGRTPITSNPRSIKSRICAFRLFPLAPPKIMATCRRLFRMALTIRLYPEALI